MMVSISESFFWRVTNSAVSLMLLTCALVIVCVPYWWWNPKHPVESKFIWFNGEQVPDGVKATRGMLLMGVLAYLCAFLSNFCIKGACAGLIFFGGVVELIAPSIFLGVEKYYFGPLQGICYILSALSMIYAIVYVFKYVERKLDEGHC